MANKFQNLSLDYSSLMRIPVNERFLAAGSEYGSSLLSALTPQQLASLFPRHYRERLPDIGGFRDALTPEGRKKIESSDTTVPSSGNRTARSTSSSAKYTPSWLKKLEETSGVTNISDPNAKAKLSSDKKEILDLLKKGEISSENPKISFLKDISESDLKKIGITITKKDDKTYYNYTEVSSQEATEAASKSLGDDKTIAKIITAKEGKSIVVEMSDGTVKKLTGDRNWRNNNPGNLEASPWTQKQPGYLGSDGRFAIFANPEQGRMAKNNLLFNVYKDQTLASAIGRYAPEIENDTESYITNISNKIGVSRGTKISDLTPEQKIVMLDAMKSVEGGKVGQTEILKQGLKLSSNPTEKQISEAKIKIEETRGQTLADLTVEKLPAGVNANIAADYEKLNPGQKQKFHEALTKLGESGVTKLNQLYDNNPTLVEQQMNRPTSLIGDGLDKVIESTSGKIRDKPISTNLRAQLNYAATQSGVQVEVTSGGQNPGQGPKGSSSRHDHGNSADLKLFRLNEKGEKVYLSMKNEADQVVMEQFVRESVRAGATGVGAGMSYMGEHTMHIGGGKPANWGGTTKNGRPPDPSPEWLSRAHAAGLQGQRDFNLANWQKEQREKRDSQSLVKKTEGSDIVPQESPRPAPAAPAPELVRRTEGSDIARSATPAAPTIDVNADGGIEKLNTDQIRAYPITDLKGDNSVVVDKNQKPLFTMNTGSETATYNPATKNVTVNPISRNSATKVSGQGLAVPVLADGGNIDVSPVTKNDPNQLTNNIIDDNQPNNNRVADENSSDQMTNTSSMIQGGSFSDNSIKVQMASSPLNNYCPSFTRAMSASEFMKHGQHYDNGSTNLR